MKDCLDLRTYMRLHHFFLPHNRIFWRMVHKNGEQSARLLELWKLDRERDSNFICPE
jgi:hypothetical protein